MSIDVLLSDLSPLAAQGVLWLNTVLTVRAREATSHSKKGWEIFTRAVMEAVLKRPHHKGVVFMAWGAYALQAINGFDKVSLFFACSRSSAYHYGLQRRNRVLTSRHPSPLSALTQPNPFIGNNHFKLANQWLWGKYGPEGEVDWTVLIPKT